MRQSFAIAALIFSTAALAQEADPATLYEIVTQGSTTQVKAGERGKVVVEIKAKPGAHVSDQAPLKIELTGREVKPEKDKLTFKDSVAQKQAGQQHVDPKFEVPFATTAPAQGAVDAKVSFFICTDKVCARQQKTLSVPVSIQ